MISHSDFVRYGESLQEDSGYGIPSNRRTYDDLEMVFRDPNTIARMRANLNQPSPMMQMLQSRQQEATRQMDMAHAHFYQDQINALQSHAIDALRYTTSPGAIMSAERDWMFPDFIIKSEGMKHSNEKKKKTSGIFGFLGDIFGL